MNSHLLESGKMFDDPSTSKQAQGRELKPKRDRLQSARMFAGPLTLKRAQARGPILWKAGVICENQ